MEMELDEQARVLTTRQLQLLTTLPPRTEQDLVRRVTEPQRIAVASVNVVAEAAEAEAARRRAKGALVSIEPVEQLAPGVPRAVVTEFLVIPALCDCIPAITLRGELEEMFRLTTFLGDDPITRLRVGREKFFPWLLTGVREDDQAGDASGAGVIGDRSEHEPAGEGTGPLDNYMRQLREGDLID
jgi:hypothetical protein